FTSFESHHITTFFILIWLFNALGFGCAILYTFCLIPLDVSVNCKNALHLAVMNDRFEVVQVLSGCIQQKIKRNSTEIRVTRMPVVFLLEYQKLYMDRRLQQAAESGSISDLYALIDENPCILENIDAMPFVNTPLHIAAASGKIAFGVEMLNLKPSFAKKLNTNGCSPLHLAVEKDQQELVTWLLRIDPSLAGVKGREGITLFHLLVLRGNVDLVVDCLMTSPECILDASVTGQNALHLAVMNDRFEVLQVLTGWIQRMSQRNARSIEYSVLNKMDLTRNTPLHLAAYKNDHQMVKLLLECRMVQRNEVNGDGLTFLDILRTHGQIDEGGELEQAALKTGCMEAASLPKLMKKTYDFFKSPITFWAYCSTHTRRISSDTSDEARGVFLIICTLLITATYQTSLQPPGGVTQSEGHAVMKQTFFIVLWVSNTIGFCCAIFYTFCLLPARAYSVSHRVLCLVPSFSSLCFDGSFPKAMAEASDGST
ncbi:BnaC05g49710D, partial [Brassica napus]